MKGEKLMTDRDKKIFTKKVKVRAKIDQCLKKFIYFPAQQ